MNSLTNEMHSSELSEGQNDPVERLIAELEGVAVNPSESQ